MASFVMMAAAVVARRRLFHFRAQPWKVGSPPFTCFPNQAKKTIGQPRTDSNKESPACCVKALTSTRRTRLKKDDVLPPPFLLPLTFLIPPHAPTAYTRAAHGVRACVRRLASACLLLHGVHGGPAPAACWSRWLASQSPSRRPLRRPHRLCHQCCCPRGSCGPPRHHHHQQRPRAQQHR